MEVPSPSSFSLCYVYRLVVISELGKVVKSRNAVKKRGELERRFYGSETKVRSAKYTDAMNIPTLYELVARNTR